MKCKWYYKGKKQLH